jgi:protein-L-isoaspartate O-methyltransferase
MNTGSYGETRYNKECLDVIKKLFTSNNLHGNWMLDMGTCSGYYSYIGKNYYKNIIAVDIYDIALENAKKHLSGFNNIEIRKGDILTFDIDKKFDLILCLVMVRSKHPGSRINVETIRRLYNLLNKDGILIVDIWGGLLENFQEVFNVEKITFTIELPDHIVGSQRRLIIQNRFSPLFLSRNDVRAI